MRLARRQVRALHEGHRRAWLLRRVVRVAESTSLIYAGGLEELSFGHIAMATASVGWMRGRSR